MEIEEGAHAGAGAATERVGDLEALEAVAGLGLLADDVEDGVDELGALGVVALGPVVAGAGLAEDEVVGAEDLAEGAGADGVHGAGLEVHQDGAGDVAAAGGLVVVHVDALELQVDVAVVGARRGRCRARTTCSEEGARESERERRREWEQRAVGWGEWCAKRGGREGRGR